METYVRRSHLDDLLGAEALSFAPHRGTAVAATISQKRDKELKHGYGQTRRMK